MLKLKACLLVLVGVILIAEAIPRRAYMVIPMSALAPVIFGLGVGLLFVGGVWWFWGK